MDPAVLYVLQHIPPDFFLHVPPVEVLNSQTYVPGLQHLTSQLHALPSPTHPAALVGVAALVGAFVDVAPPGFVVGDILQRPPLDVGIHPYSHTKVGSQKVGIFALLLISANWGDCVT